MAMVGKVISAQTCSSMLPAYAAVVSPGGMIFRYRTFARWHCGEV
jgi:hypothetical protein